MKNLVDMEIAVVWGGEVEGLGNSQSYSFFAATHLN